MSNISVSGYAQTRAAAADYLFARNLRDNVTIDRQPHQRHARRGDHTVVLDANLGHAVLHQITVACGSDTKRC